MNELSLQGHYAGFVSRLFAFVIDVVILSLAVVLATWFISTLINFFGLANVPGFVGGSNMLLAVNGLAASLIIIGYFLFFWVLSGQTIGKILMGLRVVTLNGGRMGLFRALLRMLGYWLSAFFLFAGFLWILIDDRRQGWHDKLAGTCVIYAWPARPDEKFLRDKL